MLFAVGISVYYYERVPKSYSSKDLDMILIIVRYGLVWIALHEKSYLVELT